MRSGNSCLSGSVGALHARYGSRRMVVVDLVEPLAGLPVLPDVTVHEVAAEGRRVTFACGPDAVAAVVAHLAGLATLRDISIVEPRIEEVVAQLYTAGDQQVG